MLSAKTSCFFRCSLYFYTLTLRNSQNTMKAKPWLSVHSLLQPGLWWPLRTSALNTELRWMLCNSEESCASEGLQYFIRPCALGSLPRTLRPHSCVWSLTPQLDWFPGAWPGLTGSCACKRTGLIKECSAGLEVAKTTGRTTLLPPLVRPHVAFLSLVLE